MSPVSATAFGVTGLPLIALVAPLFTLAFGGCSESTGGVSQVMGSPTGPGSASDAAVHPDAAASVDAERLDSALPSCDSVRSVELAPMTPTGSGTCEDPFLVTQPGSWALTLGPGAPPIAGAAEICSFPRSGALVRLAVDLPSGALLETWAAQAEFAGYPELLDDCAQAGTTLCQSPEIDASFANEWGYGPSTLPASLLVQAKSELLEPASVMLHFAPCAN